MITRRAFLLGGGVAVLLASEDLIAATAAGGGGYFLTATEMATLRAVTDRLVPGPPEDPDPGALDARCAEAIDLLLAAFRFDPPLIHAGGPFSGRFGGPDGFARHVALDPVAELGWRIRIEGSQGRADREFAGPVTGLQEVYRSGLAALGAFTFLPAAAQDAVLALPGNQGFVGVVLGHTLEAFYGAPEYGGNRGLVGWKSIGWRGDVEPRGYTPDEVSR